MGRKRQRRTAEEQAAAALQYEREQRAADCMKEITESLRRHRCQPVMQLVLSNQGMPVAAQWHFDVIAGA